MSYTSPRNVLTALALLGASALVPQASTSERPSPATQIAHPIVLSVDPAHSTVHWRLDAGLHTVHGTFHLKRGTLSVDTASGKATGEIVADATTGESGNDSRDEKMHKEVLESSRYAEVIFRPDRVDGTIAAQGSSTVKIHGIFSLHGADHEFSMLVQAQFTENQWKGSAKFSLPYVEWGLKNPSNFLLRVKPVVDIDIELSGSTRP